MGSAVGGIAGSLFGGSAPSVPNVQVFQPSGTGTADTQYQNLTTNRVNNNPYATYAPQAISTFNNQYNNPYAAGYQTAANTAGTTYGNTATADNTAATGLFGAGNNALTASNDVLNMGFDPQNALYARTLQQINDTVNANEASRGITSSPYGASVANTANSNFNIDWQNNQLTRAIQALGAYNTGVAGAGTDFSTGNTLGTAAGALQQLSGQAPYQAGNDIAQNQAAALQSLFSTIGNSGEGQFDESTLGNLASYLNLGAGQSDQQGNFDLQNYQNQLDAYNANVSGLSGTATSASNILAGKDGSGYAALLQAAMAA